MLVRFVLFSLFFVLAGCSWSDDTFDSIDMFSPSIADDGVYTYRVWVDNRNGNSDIFFARSDDSGITWTMEKKLNDDSSDTLGSQSAPMIEADERTGSLYVVWEDERNGNSDIYFIASMDRGDTWGETNERVNQSNQTSRQANPALDIYDSDCGVYVVWEDYSGSFPVIYFNRTLDNGKTWLSPDIQVNPNASVAQNLPKIVASMDCSAMVVWEEGDTQKDIYASFNPGGIIADEVFEDWKSPFLINDDTSGDQQSAGITFFEDESGKRSNDYFIVWQDGRGSDNDIYAALVSAGTESSSVGVNVRVSDASASGDQTTPTIGNAGRKNGLNQLFVAWADSRNGGRDIYSSASLDNNGTSWGKDEQRGIERSFNNQTSPNIALDIDADPVIVIWEEDLGSGLRNLLTDRIFP